MLSSSAPSTLTHFPSSVLDSPYIYIPNQAAHMSSQSESIFSFPNFLRSVSPSASSSPVPRPPITETDWSGCHHLNDRLSLGRDLAGFPATARDASGPFVSSLAVDESRYLLVWDVPDVEAGLLKEIFLVS